MATTLNPYINFDGNTREAMEFYKSIFGGKLDLNTYGDLKSAEDPSDENKIMHSQLETAEFKFMAADIPKKFKSKVGKNADVNFSMSLSGEDGDALKGYFEKLSEGGTVTMPLARQMWGDEFGMVDDKFGITWMVNINAKK